MSNAITTAASAPLPAQRVSTVPAQPAEHVQTPPASAPATVNKDAVRLNDAQKRKELDEAVRSLNEQVRKNSYNLNFSVDDTTNYVVVKVKDTASGDVIRQIPSETVLRVAHNIEAVKGMLRDKAV
jgi:flagellar protein FlaG